MDHDSDGEITLEEWLDYFAAVKHEKCRIANDPEVSWIIRYTALLMFGGTI